MTLVIILILLVLGTIIFHFVSPWWFTDIASNWGSIDTTIDITFWVTGIVFIAVNLFMALAIFRYRFRKDRKSRYEPENKKLEIWLTVFTTLGIAAMLAPGLFVWAQFVDTPEDADLVEVVGQQWHWNFRLPGEDGELGKVANRFIGEDNPFGVDPNDPNGADDILIFSNELHLPIDRPVKMLLRSKDVLHNFGVPQFRAKMDLVPGMDTYFWVEPNREGAFDILCMELCGLAHHTMRGRVVVEDQEAYTQWRDSHPTFAETQTAMGDATAGEARYAVCTSCHGAEGQGNAQMNSPKISGLDESYLRRQLHYYKNGVRGAHEEDEYGQQMAGMVGTLPDDQAIADVAAYIANFPDEPAEPTLENADAQRGARYYNNCSACHGDQGEGNYATNAPQLAGQHDWYLVRQINNYKQGIRGGHAEDYYGSQMVLMARTLHNEQAIADLARYLTELE